MTRISEDDHEALQGIHTSETRPQPTQDTPGNKMSQVFLVGYKRGESRSALWGQLSGMLFPLQLVTGGTVRGGW